MSLFSIARRARRSWLPSGALVLVLCGACTASSEDGAVEDTAELNELAGECASASMKSVTETLKDTSDPCHLWVKAVVGRTVGISRSTGAGAGAGAFWSQKAPAGTGLLVTSRHEFLDAPAAPQGPIPGQLGAPPHAYQPYFFVASPLPSSGALARPGNVAWRLFTRPVPLEQTTGHYNALLPENDFVVGVVTGQTLEVLARPTPVPAKFEPKPLPSTEPAGPASLGAATATVAAGQPYLALGTWGGNDLYYTVGRAATSADAKTMLASAAGSVPYDDRVEFLVTAKSMPGMSGAGVFDRTGRYAGVLVRGGTTAKGELYLRAVRATYILEALDKARASATPADAAAMKPFLPPR